jgi:hypothetical protein
MARKIFSEKSSQQGSSLIFPWDPASSMIIIIFENKYARERYVTKVKGSRSTRQCEAISLI